MQLDVEHQAVKPGPLGVGEKGLGGEIGDRLNPRRPEQAAKGTAQALVIINDSHVGLAGAAHKKWMSSVGWIVVGRLLPFREGQEVASGRWR